MVEATHFALAAIAPLAVWLLWRIQGFSVDRILRPALLKLLRYQKRAYNFVAWCGVFLHEVSHALILVLTGHGIKQFRAGIDAGHVLPKRMPRGGLRLLGFLAAAMAPLYLPPMAVFLIAWLVVGLAGIPSPRVHELVEVGGASAVDPRRLLEIPVQLPDAFLSLNLGHWAGLLVLGLSLLAMPSSRPSYVKRAGEEAEGDIAVVRRLVRKHPWPLIALAVVLYAAYFAFLAWDIRWFWTGFLFVAYVSLTGVTLALLGAVAWRLVAWTGLAKWWAGWLPYALFLAVQILARTEDVDAPLRLVNAASLVVFAAAAVAVRFMAPRRY